MRPVLPLTRALLTSGVFVALLAGFAAAGEISVGLEQLLADKADDAPVTVLVVMRDGVDVTALDLDLHEQKADLATRHVTVISTLKDAASVAQSDLLTSLAAQKSGGAVVEYTPHWLVNAVVVRGSAAAIREIAARADVEVVEPELRVELIEPVARYDGDKAGSRGIGITPGVVSINARRVWDELGIRGEGALIGSLDTGVDGNHPALANRWRGLGAPWQECWLDVLGGGSQFPHDNNGHGTHCTGTMTGLAPDDTIGVAPAAQWIAANAIGQGAGGGFDIDIITCFEWFADPDGNPFTLDDVPDVVQNSWGVHEGFGYPDCDSRWWNVIDACEATGPVVVFAAGNEGPSSGSLRSPGDRATSLTNCFTVGATSHTYPWGIAGFSSRGPAGPNCGPEENRMKPEVSAPGVSIYSSGPGGSYFYLDGTSMACPHVAGTVALMRSANPDIDVITIKEVLMATSRDLGTPGEDNDYGHGFIDAFAAVQAVMEGFGAIAGTVTDADTGAPIAGALISIVDSFQHTTAAADGSFEFLVPAGDVTLQVTAFGYANLNQGVTVVENGTTNIDLELDALATVIVSGVVRLADGTPAPGALIVIKDTPVPDVTADDTGAYAVGLPEGADYELLVSASTDGQLQLTVPFLTDLELDLFLRSVNAEGFETGDMTGQEWYQSGSAEWFAQSEEVFSGNYAARSGAIGNTSLTQMQLFADCGDGGEISFWAKVSSQSGGDFLRFYIGTDEVGAWSGEQDWAFFSFPVGAGVQSLRWRYQKDGSGQAGQDAAWVDDIVIPGGASPDPRFVVAPVVVMAQVDGPTQTSADAYLFNMGGSDLEWSASESARWLSLEPTSGTVVPGVYEALTFQFDAAGLPEGVHTAAVSVSTNDPAAPLTYLEGRLTVGSGVVAAPNELPRTFALLGAVPNPFNPTTLVRFTLPADQHAELGLYDLQGRLVVTLVSGQRPAGLNEVRWDGRDQGGRAAASGTYFARLTSGQETSVKSLTLVR